MKSHCRATLQLFGKKYRCRLLQDHAESGRRKLHVTTLRLRLKNGKQRVEIVVIRWKVL